MSDREVSAIPGTVAINIAQLEQLVDRAAERAAGSVRDHCLTAEDVQKIVERGAEEAARKAVIETLKQLGVDPGTPFEMQRDFQHLRSWRQSVETMKRQGLISAVGVMVVGAMGLFWMYLTSKGGK
jgi:hypothetical protein